jgi:hypothetical protein
MKAISGIVVLQKSAVRIITGSRYLSSSSSIFARLKLLKFVGTRKIQAAMLMFKFKLNILPEACQDYFKFSNPVRCYEICKTNYFEIPFSRTEV